MISRRISFLIVVFSMFVGGCAEQSSSLSVDSNGDGLAQFRAPSMLSSSIIVSNLELTVTLNGSPMNMTRKNDTEWFGAMKVKPGTDVDLRVKWEERIDQQMLLLAEARESITAIDRGYNLMIADASYVTTGEGFDADGDSISNLIERRQSSDPYDLNSPGTQEQFPAMVRVTGSIRSNVIDGFFNAPYWDNAQFRDVNEETLWVDSLLVDRGTQLENGNSKFKWGAIHDGRYLSLFVLGKINIPGQQNVHRDSGNFFYNDDSLEIYFDGDRSRGVDYDKVDDMQIVIPLLRDDGTPNKSGEANSLIKRGANVRDEVPFDISKVEFATCLCEGSEIAWEVRIDMVDAGIPVGKTFGFEIQINQDDDGGDRDGKWAWHRPAAMPNDINPADETWRFPVYMGEILLRPLPVSGG